MDMSPFTWNSLATISGATAATLLIVQFLKVPLDRVWKIPTRWLVWLVGFLLLLASSAVTGVSMTWENLLLLAINAIIVALAAMGSYEATFSGSDAEKEKAVSSFKSGANS